MAISIKPLHPLLAGEVSGIDLRQPLSPDQLARIEAGMDRHALLVFHDQPLSDEEQRAFSRHFGTLENAADFQLVAVKDRRLPTDMADISNLDGQNRLRASEDRQAMFALGNQLWHTDSSFKAVPAKYSILSARRIPPTGGDTEFADMRAAYDTLDDATRALIEDMVTEHSLIYSRALLGFAEFTPAEQKIFAPVRQRLVRTHPVTGRKSLLLAAHIGTIVGWPRPRALQLIRDLTEHAVQRQFVYRHVWRQHDLIMWDNRQTMHRGRPYDDLNQVRDMRRTTIAGDGPTAAQDRAA